MSDEQIASSTEGTSETAAATTTAVETAKPTLDETLAKTAEAVFAREPVQGPDGRFQPKVVAPGAPAANETPGASGTAPPEPQPEAIAAPQSLPDEVKQLWSTLPPAVQKAWSQRESESTKKITTDGQRLKEYEGVDQALELAKGFLEENRIPKSEYIRRLAVADNLLRTNPRQALAQIAQMYPGIQAAMQQPGAQPDPNSALARQVSELGAQVSTVVKASEAAAIKAAQETIDSFKKDKPHFDAVQDLMNDLIESQAAHKVPGDGTLLEKAYTLAITLHPDVKAAIDKEAADAAANKAAEEAKEKAAKDAKLAPFAQRPGSTQTAPVKGKDIWDTLQKTADTVFARS